MSWDKELEELRIKRRLGERMGGPEGVERQHGQGLHRLAQGWHRSARRRRWRRWASASGKRGERKTDDTNLNPGLHDHILRADPAETRRPTPFQLSREATFYLFSSGRPNGARRMRRGVAVRTKAKTYEVRADGHRGTLEP